MSLTYTSIFNFYNDTMNRMQRQKDKLLRQLANAKDQHIAEKEFLIKKNQNDSFEKLDFLDENVKNQIIHQKNQNLYKHSILDIKKLLLNEAITGIKGILMSKQYYLTLTSLIVTEKEARFQMFGIPKKTFQDAITHYDRTRDTSVGAICQLLLIFKRRMLM